MKSIIGLSIKDRESLFQESSKKMGISPLMIEKDFWVCWTLKSLFSMPEIGDHLVFKGGTSLSKVWKAIHRFSEDIDISIDRNWLGFSGEKDPEKSPSKKKRKKQIDSLAQSCATQLKEKILPHLVMDAKGNGIEGANFSIDPADPQTILFFYPSSILEKDSYVKKMVRIEAGSRSDVWPTQEAMIKPYIAECFSDQITDCDVRVNALSIQRTFWEKATILHAEAHRPMEKETPPRYSRHYSDLVCISKIEEGIKALENDDLRKRVVEHKCIFFESSWSSLETATPGTFKLIPNKQRLDGFKKDYTAMAEMYFETPQSWDSILDDLKKLESKINTARD